MQCGKLKHEVEMLQDQLKETEIEKQVHSLVFQEHFKNILLGGQIGHNWSCNFKHCQTGLRNLFLSFKSPEKVYIHPFFAEFKKES